MSELSESGDAAVPPVGATPADHAATPAPGPAGPGLRARLRITLEVIRANPTGRVALKVVIGVIGAIVTGVGIVLIPLPGPGWALVILGLAIWAIEFVWARHLLQFTRRHVHAWTRWVTRQSLPVRMMLGAVGMVFVSAVVWTSVKLSMDIDLIKVAQNFLATL